MELTPCEKVVMDVIWDSDRDLTLPEIIDRINNDPRRAWSKKAVSAFLKRLCKKRFLFRCRNGNGQTLYHVLLNRKMVTPYLTISVPRQNISPFL